ncbi:hypothetical protein [Candidatus Palauibacter sp.]|uniref:hypothetical protein n=1 Tax=Candidatus Palauibacter sp. TaxID=3101350 RepID=UPI003C6F65B2
MNRFEPLVRMATPLALAFILGVAWTTVGPSALGGQGQEECIDNRDLLGPCVNMAHSYEGSCEGSVCYSRDEGCCLEEIIVIIRR